MAEKAIHILPGDHDWIVRDESGRETGRYPTRESAEVIGRSMARKHRVGLAIYDRLGNVERVERLTGWFEKILRRRAC